MSLAWLVAAFSSSAALAAAASVLGSLRRERERVQLLEKRFAEFRDALPIGVFETDNHGSCSYANAPARTLAGIAASGRVGEAWLDAIHPDDRDRVVNGWMAAAAVGRTFRGEYRFLRPNGSIVWVLGEVRPHCDARGHRLGFVGALTDITDHKLVALELERSRAELEARVAERTATLCEANRLLSREARVRERIERVTIGPISADVKPKAPETPRRHGPDQ